MSSKEERSFTTVIQLAKETCRESCLIKKGKQEEEEGEPEQCGKIIPGDGQASSTSRQQGGGKTNMTSEP